MYSCEKEDSTIVDPILNFPVLDSVFVTPTAFDTSRINIDLRAYVTSIDPIGSVTARFVDPDGNTFATVNLIQEGQSYFRNLDTILPCWFIGGYKIEFVATTVSGLNSSIINRNFQVSNPNNQPPLVSNLVITPDSLQLTDSTFFIFMITATDPNGQCDILKVFYTGLRPDNTNLTPVNLYDDGSCCQVENTGLPSGDTTANDTKYTRKFFGGPTQLGYYRYYLKAIDRSGDTSNVLADSIYIYP